MSTTYKLTTSGFPREEHSLKTGAYRLGSASDNEIVLQDPCVAPHHCELVVTANTMTLKSLSPSFETFVNDQKVESVRLEGGQTVRLGDVSLQLEAVVTDSNPVGAIVDPVQIAGASIAKAKQGLAKPSVRAGLLVGACALAGLLAFLFWPSNSDSTEEPAAVADHATSEGEGGTNLVEKQHETHASDEASSLPAPALAQAQKAYNPAETNRAPELDIEAAELRIQRGGSAPALPFLTRALRNQEATQGGGSAAVTRVLDLLGNLYRSRQQYDRAEPLLTRTLANLQAGENVPLKELARAQNNLGELYLAAGQPEKAAPLLEKALEARKEVLKADDPAVAISLNNAAAVHAINGDHAGAKPLLEEALKVFEKNYGADSPTYAQGLNNLAELHRALGEDAEAKPLLEQALAIKEKAVGPEDPSLASTLNALAAVHAAEGDLQQAEPLLERAAELTEKAVGPNHPDTAASLDKLAGLYQAMGQPEKASPLYKRSEDINKQALGPNHPQTVMSQRKRAQLERCQGGDPELGAELSAEAVQSSFRLLSAVTRFGSREERMAMLAMLNPCDLAISVGSPQGIAEAVLRYKAVLVDSLLEDGLIEQASQKPENADLVQALLETRKGLSDLLFEIPEDLSEEAKKLRVEDAETLVSRLRNVEQAMSSRSAGFGNAARALETEVAQVQGTLGADTVLVEFVKYEDCPGTGNGTPSYGALVLGSGGEPRWIPLGVAQGIDAGIARLQVLLRTAPADPVVKSAPPETPSTEEGKDPAGHGETPRETGPADESPKQSITGLLKELHAQLWTPVESALTPGIRSVILSPDSELNLLSFSTLVAADDRFVGERFLVQYVAAGRDLLGPKTGGAEGSLYLFANPDFAAGSMDESPAAESEVKAAARALRTGLQSLALPRQTSFPQEIAFAHLHAIKAKMEAGLFLGARASEAELANLKDARILFLGAPGYGLPTVNTVPGGDGAFSDGRRMPFTGPRVEATEARGKLMPLSGELFYGHWNADDPTKRGGVVLAGAKAAMKSWDLGHTSNAANDGIVTSDDLGKMGMAGVELVVMPAWETAVGAGGAGEAVLALRRALVQAGAASLLLGFRSAGDEVTARMFGEFYDRFRSTENPVLAFAEVQQNALSRIRSDQGIETAARSVGSFLMSSRGTHL
jgi:tetratricopeptide (TPR) repeat protein